MSISIANSAKKFVSVFQDATDRQLNEADTVTRIGKFIEEVLGYDVLMDFTKEFSVKDRYVDIALKLPGVTIFIEAKQAGTLLREKHIEQACNYASNAGVEWVILSNGAEWQLYHLTFEDGIETSLMFSASLLTDFKKATDVLSMLHKKNVLKGSLDDFLSQHDALSAESILRAIMTEEALNIIRRKIRKDSGGSVDREKLVSAIKSIIKNEVWEEIGEIRIRKKRGAKRTKQHRGDSQNISEAQTETEPPSSLN